MYSEKFYRYDIQGLRAFSALIIMIYHIWLNKVSGGVDVFFVISGFLIGTQFLRNIEQYGTVYFVNFWARILSRIIPTAYFVIIATTLLSLFFIPPALWKMGVNEFITSILNIQNWELYRVSTNYLARDNPPSQYQQFWALSIQIQFYLIVISIFIIASWFLKKRPNFKIYLYILVFLFLISFIYSIFFTNISPAQAYFNTGTRLWEFVTGVIAAYLYPQLKKYRIKNNLKNNLYVLSFLLFISSGFLIPKSFNFPGWIAIIPVFSAFFFILIGGIQSHNKNHLNSLLETKLMQKMGELSFTIYLWHWPLLIFTQYYFNNTNISLIQGIFIIINSIFFAYFTHRFIEHPALKTLRSYSSLRTFSILSISIIFIASIGLIIRFKIISEAHIYFNTSSISYLKKNTLPSERANINPSLKSIILSNYDRPHAINHCLSGPICTYGNKKSDFIVALVGVSHAAQWQPVLEYAANKYNFKLVTILSLPKDITIKNIQDIKPNIVITNSTITNDKNSNELLNGINLWKKLTSQGIKVIGIRDNPRFSIYQNACISKNKNNLLACSLEKNKVFSNEYIAKKYEKIIPGFYAVDLTDLICFEKVCPATVNGYIIYYDRHHFSSTFMKYISEAATNEIVRQAPGILNR